MHAFANRGPRELAALVLLVVSLVWAASFGLIKHALTGVDPHAVAWARISIALPLFLPFMRIRGHNRQLVCQLLAIGSLQYGLMYILYIQSFSYLDAHEVALWTVTTPVYVALCSDLFARRLHLRTWTLAGLAVVGAAVLSTDRLPSLQAHSTWLWGVALVQVANLCFAFGQVAYRRVRRRHTDLVDRHIFIYLLLGACMITGITTAISGGASALWQLDVTQWGTLIYLGSVATGLGFFAWNWGAARVAPATLSVFNNLKIPLAIILALTVFGEQVAWDRFIVGVLLVCGTAWFVRRG